MHQKIKLKVIMAGEYDIPVGKKIEFSYDDENKLYIASCEKSEFGIVEKILKGSRKELEQLGREFCGIVLVSQKMEQKLEVKVFKHVKEPIIFKNVMKNRFQKN